MRTTRTLTELPCFLLPGEGGWWWTGLTRGGAGLWPGLTRGGGGDHVWSGEGVVIRSDQGRVIRSDQGGGDCVWPREGDHVWPREGDQVWPREGDQVWPREGDQVWPREGDQVWPREGDQVWPREGDQVWPEEGWPPPVTYPMINFMSHLLPLCDRKTDVCENITFATRVVKIQNSVTSQLFLTFLKASANFPNLMFLFAMLLVKADRTRDKANRMNVTM